MGQPLAAPIFSIGNLPSGLEPDIGGHEWGDFRKGGTTRAIRIEGTFRVVTVHGGPPLVCHDGWLAIDSKGHPYPIEDEVFRATYEPALKPGDSDVAPGEWAAGEETSVAGSEAGKALNHLIIARSESVDPAERERINAAITAAHKVVEPEQTAPSPDGWQGEPPAEGTRRKVILDTIHAANPDLLEGPAEELALVDAIEEALLASGAGESAPVEPPQGGER